MIPKILHRIWLSKVNDTYESLSFENNVNNVDLNECINSQTINAKGFTIKEWTNKDVNLFMNIPLFRKVWGYGNMSFCADIIRLYALSMYGGIYLDTDVYVYQSLNIDELFNNLDIFMGFECVESTCGDNAEYEDFLLHNRLVSMAIIGCSRNNEFMKQLYNYILTCDLCNKFFAPNYVTKFIKKCWQPGYKIIKTFEEAKNVDKNIVPLFTYPYFDRAYYDDDNPCEYKLFDHRYSYTWKKFKSF